MFSEAELRETSAVEGPQNILLSPRFQQISALSSYQVSNRTKKYRNKEEFLIYNNNNE